MAHQLSAGYSGVKPDPSSQSFDSSKDISGASVGEVIKLDRGFPLVKLENRDILRCENGAAFEKFSQTRAVIGDIVDVEIPESHDKAVIVNIHPRRSEFVRKDPAERSTAQVLAANFDRVIIVQPLSEVNMRRLERELVLAHETGVEVAVLLTKSDLANNEEQIENVRDQVCALVGSNVKTLTMSTDDPRSVEAVRSLLKPGTTTVLIGRSGVGKSSLINKLVGEEMLPTMPVRESDGKGRHTTVSREIIEIPGGGRVIDMPGIRGLGLWDADAGIEAAFSDIEEIAEQCRFRDCQHQKEPGCAVRAALAAGEITPERFDSYCALKQETTLNKKRREQARWMSSEQAPESKRVERMNAGILKQKNSSSRRKRSTKQKGGSVSGKRGGKNSAGRK